MDFPHKEITETILNRFYKVYNILGYGFLEKIYQNSLAIELIQAGFQVETEKSIPVYYCGRSVGNYFADVVVNNAVVLELKAAEGLDERNEQQLRNYLRASNIEVGLLLNFGKKPEFKRIYYSNARKCFLKTEDAPHVDL